MVIDFVAQDINKGVIEKPKKVALVLSKFTPLTKGMSNKIISLTNKFDAVMVIAYGVLDEDVKYPKMNLDSRYQSLRQRFKDIEDIRVSMIKLDDLMINPKEFKKVLDSIRDTYIVNKDIEFETEYFYSESKWSDMFNNDFGMSKANLSTFLHNEGVYMSPMDNWETIDPTFKRYFRKVVSVVGASSGGKSTLARYLSHLFGDLQSKEFIRSYNNNLHRFIDERKYTARDYLSIITGQLTVSENALASNSDAKVVFLDTCPIVSDAYIRLSKNSFSEEDYKTLLGMTKIAKDWSKKNVDLYIEVPYNTEFVLDGLRNGHFEKTREIIHEYINQNVKELGQEDKIYYLDGKSYEENKDLALKKVEELLK